MRMSVGMFRGSFISSSHTLTPKREPKDVSTARWHMMSLCSAGVLSEGLSGRAPHGVIQTSSASFEWTAKRGAHGGRA